jgi:hypothetical protein
VAQVLALLALGKLQVEAVAVLVRLALLRSVVLVQQRLETAVQAYQILLLVRH